MKFIYSVAARAFVRVAALGLAALACSQASGVAFGSEPPQADGCHCEQYKGLEGFSSLADEVAAVGIQAVKPGEGDPVTNQETKVAALRLRITSNSLIPDACKKKLLHDLAKPNVTIFARAFFGFSTPQSAPGTAPASGLYSSFGSAYGNYLSQTVLLMCGVNQSASCKATAAQTAWTKFGQALGSNPASVGLGASSSSDIQVMQAYHQALTVGSEADLLAYISAKKDGLNTQQFLEFVQMVGARLAGDYDNARAAQGLGAPGVVTGDQLLTAAQADQIYGLNVNAGVCRDIMTLQAKMLQARGFPNTYTLSYGVPGDYHTVAISGDPNSPTKFYTLSYDQLTANSGLDGSEALFQRGSVNTIGYADSSLNYIIARPEGAVVAIVPSAMEKFLEEAAGFDIHQIDPLSRETNSMLGTGLSVSSDNGRVTATTKLVAGQDGVGAQYVGASESVSYGQGTIAPGKIGLFVGDQHRPASIYGTVADEDAMIAYLQLEQHLMTPKIKIGSNTTLTVDNSLTFAAMGGGVVNGVSPKDSYQGELPDKGVAVFGGDLRARSEVRVDQTLDEGKLHSQYRAGVQVSPGTADVRDLFANPTVALNSVYAGTTQTLRVGDVNLFANVTAAVDNLGTRGIAEVGAAGSKFGGSAYVAGRITGGTSMYEDNSIRRAGVNLTYRPNKYLQLGINGEMPIEGDVPMSTAHLMGTAIVNF